MYKIIYSFRKQLVVLYLNKNTNIYVVCSGFFNANLIVVFSALKIINYITNMDFTKPSQGIANFMCFHVFSKQNSGYFSDIFSYTNLLKNYFHSFIVFQIKSLFTYIFMC